MNISDKSMKLIHIVSLIFIGLMILLWIVGESIFSGMEDEAAALQSYIIIGVLAVATIFLLILGFMYKLSTDTGKIWFLIGLGMLGWLIGEIIYTYYDLFTDERLFPVLPIFPI